MIKIIKFPSVPEPESRFQKKEKEIKIFKSIKNLLELLRKLFRKKKYLLKDELYLILDTEFNILLEELSPLEDTFSAEDELKKIRKLSGEKKKAALKIFKEKLFRQTEALAICRLFIERLLENEPDISKEKVRALIRKFIQNYGFNSKQVEIINSLLNKYYENRNKILEIKRKFADKRLVVYKLTGIMIGKEEPVEVSFGPMTIDIKVSGSTMQKMLAKAINPLIISYPLPGFLAQSGEPESIYFTVTNLDKITMLRIYKDPEGKKTLKRWHEYIKSLIFSSVLELAELPIEPEGYLTEKDPEIKKIILENFFKSWQRWALEQVKSDILAYLMTEGNDFLKKYKTWIKSFFFLTEFSPRDYLAKIRTEEKFRDDNLYQKMSKKILIDEYRKIIEQAVEALVRLINEGKYSIQEAGALLSYTLLERWPRTVERLLRWKMVKNL